MDITTMVAELESRQLKPDVLTHRNHIQIAWYYLSSMPLADASQQFRKIMQGYVTGLGMPNSFHLTLSESFMRVIHARMAANDRDWDAFERGNSELFSSAKALIARHYSPEQLERGRRVFVEPDRMALPC